MNDTREDINDYVGLGLLDPADLLILGLLDPVDLRILGLLDPADLRSLGLLDPADLRIRSIRMKLSCSLVGIVMFSRKKVWSFSGFSWSLDPAGSREHEGELQLNPSWNTKKQLEAQSKSILSFFSFAILKN